MLIAMLIPLPDALWAQLVVIAIAFVLAAALALVPLLFMWRKIPTPKGDDDLKSALEGRILVADMANFQELQDARRLEDENRLFVRNARAHIDNALDRNKDAARASRARTSGKAY